MITLKNVSFSYPEKSVLTDFSLTVGDGETICLSGPSGCGKTTVLRLMAGLEFPVAGEVLVDGRIAMVFQEHRLLPWLTARENILLVAPEANADELLAAIGLDGEGDAPVGSLSGGMQRRVAIARAVAARGDILLLDEPFNGLDDETAANAATLILTAYVGKIIVLVSHHERDVALLQAKVFKMA